MSPEEHYARAEELLADTVMVRGQLSHQGEWFEHLLARAQVHATLALFTPAVSVNVQNPKSADEIYRQREEGARLSRNPEALRRIKAALDSTEGDTEIENPTASSPCSREAEMRDLKAERDMLKAGFVRAHDLASEWELSAGPASKAWKVLGPQKVSVPFAVKSIRVALDGGSNE